MSERERHGKRRTRPEDAPDPDDRYDPRQGAKKSRKEELSPDLGPPRISVRDDLSFSDRYDPQTKPDVSERSESTRRSRSKERATHSSRDHREHTSSRDRRDPESSRSHRRSHHSPDKGATDKQRFSDSKPLAATDESRSPRQGPEHRPDQTELRIPRQGSEFGSRGGHADRGGFGRGGFAAGRGLGRGRGQFDGPGFQGHNQGGDWGSDGPHGGIEGGRGGRGAFVPRGRFGGGGRFGGRFEGGGRMEGGRFEGSFRGRGSLPFRGRGGRTGFLANGMPGDTSAPTPFSRGQDGPAEAGLNRPGPAPGRGAFTQGGRGGGPGISSRPAVDPAIAARRKANADARLRQQVSQLRIAPDLVPERLHDKYQLLLKTSDGKTAPAADTVQIASAYMYSAIHDEQPSAAVAAGKGADRAAFDAAVELYQRPQAAQWTRPSKHGTFILTSVQIMTNV